MSLGVRAFPELALSSAIVSAINADRAGFVEGLGQKLLDDRDLRSLNRCQLGAIALGELLNGVAALLDHRGQGLLLLGRRQRLALLDGFVFERVLDQPQRSGPYRIVGLHGGHNVLADLGFQVLPRPS